METKTKHATVLAVGIVVGLFALVPFATTGTAGPAPRFTIVVTGNGATQLAKTGSGQCDDRGGAVKVDAHVAGGAAGNAITGTAQCRGTTVAGPCTATRTVAPLGDDATCSGAQILGPADREASYKAAAGAAASSWYVLCSFY